MSAMIMIFTGLACALVGGFVTAAAIAALRLDASRDRDDDMGDWWRDL